MYKNVQSNNLSIKDLLQITQLIGYLLIKRVSLVIVKNHAWTIKHWSLQIF